MQLVLALLSVLPAVQAPPPARAVDLRFHRVHLRNGNFVDGALEHQTAEEISLRISTGTITINRDLVDRVEYVKMRGILEAPGQVEKPTRRANDPSLVERVEPIERPRTVPAAAYSPSAPMKLKVDEIVARLAAAPAGDVDAILQEIVDVEGDTTSYVASLMGAGKPALALALGPVLAQRPDRTAIPQILALLKHSSGAIRAYAAAGLGVCGDAGQIPALAGLARDPHPGARAAAVTAITAQDAETTFDALIPFASDADREVRTRALGALTITSGKHQLSTRLVQVLSDALGRAGPVARGDVLLAMGQSGVPSLSTTIASHLTDASASVRMAAAVALGDMGDPTTADAVLSRLGSENDDTTRVALVATAVRVKAKEAFPLLISWLEDANPLVMNAAMRGLRDFSGVDFKMNAAKWEIWWEKNKP